MTTCTLQVFLVTGGNTGVGFHTVEQLAKHGARVYMGARSPEKASAALKDIKAHLPNTDIHFLHMDMMDLQSVVAAAKQFKLKEGRLHGLVNNVGIMATPFARSAADGFEAQWQTNYVGHWLLTWHLLDIMLSTASGEGTTAGDVRVVNVTSDGHQFAPNKLANILYAKHLNTMYGMTGSGDVTLGDGGIIWTAAVHPGHLDTNLNKQTPLPICFNTVLRAVGAYSHPSGGAYDSIFAAASPAFKPDDSGGYFVPGQKRKLPSKIACDIQLAERLWEWTREEMQSRNLLE
ncbi:hypothetical protein BJX70DRAFT_393222 [Aspergillus crustosus]